MVFGHPIFEKNSPRGEPHGGDRTFYIIIFSVRGGAKTFGFGAAKVTFLLLTDSA